MVLPGSLYVCGVRGQHVARVRACTGREQIWALARSVRRYASNFASVQVPRAVGCGVQRGRADSRRRCERRPGARWQSPRRSQAHSRALVFSCGPVSLMGTGPCCIRKAAR